MNGLISFQNCLSTRFNKKKTHQQQTNIKKARKNKNITYINKITILLSKKKSKKNLNQKATKKATKQTKPKPTKPKQTKPKSKIQNPKPLIPNPYILISIIIQMQEMLQIKQLYSSQFEQHYPQIISLPLGHFGTLTLHRVMDSSEDG